MSSSNPGSYPVVPHHQWHSSSSSSANHICHEANKVSHPPDPNPAAPQPSGDQTAQPRPSRRSRKRNGGGPPQLQFLTATDPSQFKDEKAKRSVRSQAMIQYRYKSSEQKRKNNESSSTTTTAPVDPPPAKAISNQPKASSLVSTANDVLRHPPPTASTGPPKLRSWWDEVDDQALYRSTLEAWRGTSQQGPAAITAPYTTRTTALSISFRPRRYLDARTALDSTVPAHSVLDYERTAQHDQRLLDIALEEASKRFPRGFGNGVDPFLVLPKFESRELDSFMLVRTCNRTFSSASTLKRWLPAMLSHPHILLSSTIVACTWMDMHAGVRGESRRTAVVKGEILSWIKGRLNSAELQAHDSTMIVIVHMLAGEMWSCNEQTLRWHEMGVAKLIAHRGGMDNLMTMGPVGITCAIVCLHSDIICEAAPLPEFAQWNPPPILEDGPEALPESPLFYRTPELVPVVKDPACNMYTYEIICDMRDLTDLFLSLHAGSDSIVDAEISAEMSVSRYNNDLKATPSTVDYDAKVAEIRTKLALLPSAFVPGLPTSGDFVYEACRITAIIYTSAIIMRVPLSVAAEPARNVVLLDRASVQPPEVFTKRLTQSLYEIIERTNVGDIWGDMAGVFYWVSAVGAAASRTSVTTDMYQEPTSLSEEYTTWTRRCLIMFATRAMIILVFKHPVPVSIAQKRLLKVQELLSSRTLRKAL
ncbi:unnamed protein product [Periconia digitata]|uniref:Tachykinin family protein n=1 Tax=Periconia digitata TaxID=1303443 RepID=A0A9W4U9J6_9PLEO|nr:unnamed protein product [Periconia digitata]